MEIMEQTEASEVSILLTDDQEMRQLNRHYRDIDAPTDVLAFSQIEEQGDFFIPDTSEEHLLGDIVISIETAQRQASHFNHSLEEELTILLIHGLLHLLGYDHFDEEEAKKMQSLESKIWHHMFEKTDEKK